MYDDSNVARSEIIRSSGVLFDTPRAENGPSKALSSLLVKEGRMMSWPRKTEDTRGIYTPQVPVTCPARKSKDDTWALHEKHDKNVVAACNRYLFARRRGRGHVEQSTRHMHEHSVLFLQSPKNIKRIFMGINQNPYTIVQSSYPNHPILILSIPYHTPHKPPSSDNH